MINKRRSKSKLKRISVKKILIFIAILGLSLLSFNLVSITLPYIYNFGSKIAVMSAGLSMPEGGKNLLNKSVTTLFNNTIFKDYNATDSMSVNNDNDTNDASTSKQSSQETNSQQTQAVSTDIPANPGNLIRKQYTAGSTENYIKLKNNAYIKNETKLAQNTILNNAINPPAFKLEKTDKPQVLIMHTHATESYEPAISSYFDKDYKSRSTDNTKNVIRVGEEIGKQLKQAGIGYIIDRTQHDYPSYNGSYERSEATVKSYLEKYPTIKVVLDVHRDAIQADENTRIAPVAKINGKNAAQLMIISGADNGVNNYPNYMQNLKFASRLQEQLEQDYPGITRPIAFKYAKYNQHLTTGSLLFEMGGHGNSLDEAIYLGELVGKSLGKLLNSLK